MELSARNFDDIVLKDNELAGRFEQKTRNAIDVLKLGLVMALPKDVIDGYRDECLSVIEDDSLATEALRAKYGNVTIRSSIASRVMNTKMTLSDGPKSLCRPGPEYAMTVCFDGNDGLYVTFWR